MHGPGPLADVRWTSYLAGRFVLIMGHQAFFTEVALSAIATTTLANIAAFEDHGEPLHPVPIERLV